MQNNIIMSKYFITFGGGSENYIDAGKRLIKQADNIKLFDKHILYTDTYLRNDSLFWDMHGDFIKNNKRGYGYWIWKPYIIKKTLEQMNENDILLYLDGGCEIDCGKKHVMEQFFGYVKNDNIINSKTIFKENQWDKMDLIQYLSMNADKYLNTPQYQAGTILMVKCDIVESLINEWYSIACNYHMLDDTPSISKNSNNFCEHRHDQSIYSLLIKKYNITSSKNMADCVETIRNRSGISKIGNIKTIKSRIKNISEKVTNELNVIRSNVIKPDVGKSNVDRMAIDGYGVGNFDISKPNTSKSDAIKPNNSRLNTGKLNIGKPNTSKPNTSKSDTIKLNTIKLNTSKLNTNKLNTIKLNTSKLNTSKLNTSKLNTSKLNTSKLNTSKLNTSKLNTSKPNTSKPNTSKLNTSKLNTSKLNTSKLNTSKLNTSKLNTSKPNTSKPNTSKPNTSKQNTSKPNTIKSDVSKFVTNKSHISKINVEKHHHHVIVMPKQSNNN